MLLEFLVDKEHRRERAQVAKVGITELGEIAGLSPRALRYYEQQGLIEARRDRYNVRCYDWRGRTRALLIAQFRRAGLSLTDIRNLLEVADLGEGETDVKAVAVHKLRERLSRLDRERDSVQTLLGRLGAHGQDNAPMLAVCGGRSRRSGSTTTNVLTLRRQLCVLALLQLSL